MPVTPGTFCTVTYAYDNVGNLYQKTSPKPNQSSCSTTVTTSLSYDADNRLRQKSYNDGSTPTAKYGYDGIPLTGCTTAPPVLTDNYSKGYRTAMCDGSGATSWQHDMMGRIWSESRKIGTITNSIGYTYNLDGSTAALTYPSGRRITYTPGGAGRPLSAIDSTGPKNYVTGAHYAAPGELANYTYGAGITNTNAYNNRLQPTSLSATGPSGAILSLTYDFHLGNGNNGNVYQITNGRDPNRSATYSYDSLNRITQAYSAGQNWGETFSTDAWSNLNGRSPANGKTNYEALSVAALNSNRLSGFGYDAAGNMTSNGAATFTYDAENRLLTTAGVTYAYDGDGNRVKKSSGTLYWGTTLAESDLTATASSWKEYIFFAGKRVARREAVDNKAHYYYSDHLGSTSLVTDEAGTMSLCTNSPTGYTSIPTGEEESDFYPYGGEMKLCDRKPQNYKFTGKERDTESGLDNFGARFDASSLGRFMSPDAGAFHWDTPQSLNRYAHCLNNPLRFLDPDGKDVVDIGTFILTTYIQKSQEIGKLDWAFAMAAAGASEGPIVTKPVARWGDMRPVGSRIQNPINFIQPEHPVHGSLAGAWYSRALSVMSVSVDFREDPGAGMTASIQVKQSDRGVVTDGSKSGMNYWRDEDEPEQELGQFRLKLSGLSDQKLAALSFEAAYQYLSTGGQVYQEILTAASNEEKERQRRKCAASAQLNGQLDCK